MPCGMMTITRSPAVTPWSRSTVGLNARALTELGKGHGFAFVFVDPGGDEWAICGSGFERVDEIAKSVHAAVIVSGGNEDFQLR